MWVSGRRLRSAIDLKADPRTQTTVSAPEAALTGEVTPIATLARHSVTFALLALAEQDTEKQRMARWPVRPNRANDLPSGLDVLASGRRHGRIAGPQ
jgi:hypothetical protein